jgi:putative hydrolase
MDSAVDWSLAERTARELAREGDRAPSAAEQTRLAEALRIAEHWLDATGLPAAPDAGVTRVLDRSAWIDTAIVQLRRIVDPIAGATTEALVGLASQQLDELGTLLDDEPDALGGALGDALGGALGGALDLDRIDLTAFGLSPADADAMREQLRAMLGPDGDVSALLGATLGAMRGQDPGAMLRPAAATLNALQAGQVIGSLARQVHGHRDLGVPTAPGSHAGLVAVNVAATFDGYELADDEIAVAIAVTEAAHRRLHHAVGWLDAHLETLIARFAAAMTVDEDQLRRVAEQVQQDLDPEDPEAFARALERAGRLRLEPNPAQRAILAQLQTIVALTGAWARHEARVAVAGRLPDLDRIEEVLRRRRATRGDGEELLAGLLGLDLQPPDEGVAERFVTTVLDVLGTDGLRRALAHPENLPDADELADPGSWLVRAVDEVDVPDDVGALLGELSELGAAPREASAAERGRPDHGGPEDGSDDGSEDGPEADGDARA